MKISVSNVTVSVSIIQVTLKQRTKRHVLNFKELVKTFKGRNLLIIMIQEIGKYMIKSN